MFLRNVVLVGEVDAGFDQRQRLDQPLAPGLRARAEHALEMLERLPALRFGLGRHQIGEAFDRGQIHAAVLERAAGELAGLGVPKAVELASAASTAAITARPPCTCSSAMSSPVSLFGAGNQSARPSSMTLAGGGIAHARQRRPPRLAAPGRSAAPARRRARGPEMRMTAIAAGGRPEESAKMVSRSVAMPTANPRRVANQIAVDSVTEREANGNAPTWTAAGKLGYRIGRP